ncbi:epoxyqueuosine reductase QueH [Coxiella-like endosymbiont]
MCCAPCAGAIIDRFSESGIDFKIFFYNPNIHSEK